MRIAAVQKTARAAVSVCPNPTPRHGGSGQESLWGRMGILTAKAVLSLAHHSQWQAEVLSSHASAGRVVGARIWLGR